MLAELEIVLVCASDVLVLIKGIVVEVAATAAEVVVRGGVLATDTIEEDKLEDIEGVATMAVEDGGATTATLLLAIEVVL